MVVAGGDGGAACRDGQPGYGGVHGHQNAAL